MSKNNDNKLVPKLRFPEFKNKEEWEKDLLGNIAKDIATGKLDANAMTEDGQYRFYTCAKDYYKIDNYAFDTEALLIAGNGAYLGYIHHYVGKFNAYQRTYVLSDFTKNVIYLKYFLQRFLPYRISREKKDGNTPYIVLGTLTEMPIYVPKSPKEQQKIASCLSSLDEVITAEGQKLDLLKEHKKGLLQNLFPQEGETVPKLRFKEFEDRGDWEVKKLIDVCEINPKVSQLPDEFVYIDLESVDKGKLLQKKIINRDEAPSRAQRLLEDNDVAYQTVRPYQKNNYYFKKNDDYDYVASTGYAQLRAFQSSMFLFQLIHTDSFVSEVLKKCSGSNYPAINSSDLSQIALEIPTNIEEQQKIADTLSSLDDLINAQSQKIEALQLHKKGLLQGLFPYINTNNK